MNIDLRDCLRTMLFQRWQRMVGPPENQQRQPNKRRKRKSSVSSTGRGGKAKNSNIMSPGPPSFPLASKVSCVSVLILAVINCNVFIGY